MFQRIVALRAVWNGTYKCHLCQIQVRCRLTEISPARCLNTIISIGKKDIIDIELQNLIFRIFLFHLCGHENLLDLTGIRLIRIRQIVRKDITGKLLCNSTGTSGRILSPQFVKEQGHPCTDQCLRIISGMLVKVAILCNHKRILYILRDLVKGKIIGIMISLELCQNLALGIINKACLRGLKSILRGSLHHLFCL